MDKIIDAFMENPETGFMLIKVLIEKYKPMAYEIGNVFVDIYKDFANNNEYPLVVAKAKKNMYDAYVNVGFTEDQALALMIYDNIKLMDNIKKVTAKSNTSKKN